MVSVVVDTSILIDHLRKASTTFIELSKLQSEGKVRLLIPLIVVVELFIGKSTKIKRVERLIDQILDEVELVSLTRKSAKIAGCLVRDYQHLSDPYDLLIAAIALEKKAKIATLNIKHFKPIKGLRLYRV
ncbi:MAG: PIN domain-containing protein [Candidatus Beckwithbacteria bacterium]|nr:PIN domain-containing protein [Patescibacteria group bacterium]